MPPTSETGCLPEIGQRLEIAHRAGDCSRYCHRETQTVFVSPAKAPGRPEAMGAGASSPVKLILPLAAKQRDRGRRRQDWGQVPGEHSHCLPEVFLRWRGMFMDKPRGLQRHIGEFARKRL